MNIDELKKLNKEKMKIPIYSVIVIITSISLLIFGKIPQKVALLGLLVSVIFLPLLLYYFFTRKLEKVLVPYVLSQCFDWNMAISITHEKTLTKNNPWGSGLLPPEDIMFSNVLPVYVSPILNITIAMDLFIRDSFAYDNNVDKTISQIQYLSRNNSRNSRNNRFSFYAGIIKVKNNKNLGSITYFQTNNYPKGTEKYITKENAKLELPKIEVPEAYQYNIDVYTDNPSIAEKLATQDLFITMQTVKQQFNLKYIKVIFANDYTIFVLRHSGWGFLSYPTFGIKIPLFKDIDYPLMDRAVNNFKTLTCLADKATGFIKDI